MRNPSKQTGARERARRPIRRRACAPSARRSRNSRACTRPTRLPKKHPRLRPKVCGARCVSSVTTHRTGVLPWPGLLDENLFAGVASACVVGLGIAMVWPIFSRYGDTRLLAARAATGRRPETAGHGGAHRPCASKTAEPSSPRSSRRPRRAEATRGGCSQADCRDERRDGAAKFGDRRSRKATRPARRSSRRSPPRTSASFHRQLDARSGAVSQAAHRRAAFDDRSAGNAGRTDVRAPSSNG